MARTQSMWVLFKEINFLLGWKLKVNVSSTVVASLLSQIVLWIQKNISSGNGHLYSIKAPLG